jgi:hypothetical protein
MRLALHVKRGTDGKAAAEDIVDGASLWRFTARMKQPDGRAKTKTFPASDWHEAEIEAAKWLDDLRACRSRP